MERNLFSLLVGVLLIGVVYSCEKPTYRCFNCEADQGTASSDYRQNPCWNPKAKSTTFLKKCDYCAKQLVESATGSTREIKRTCVYEGQTPNSPSFIYGCNEMTDQVSNRWTICTCKGKLCNSAPPSLHQSAIATLGLVLFAFYFTNK